MDFASESESPKTELEEIEGDEPVNKIRRLEINSESKCIDQVNEESKGELTTYKSECIQNTEDLENNCDTVLNLDSNAEEQNDMLCSTSKSAFDGNKDDEKKPEEKSDNESNFNKDSENTAIEKIKVIENEKSTEVEYNDLSNLNQNAEQVDTDNAGNENQVQSVDQASSSSTQVRIREKCKYGNQCYRLNAEHKAKFSHPGDADYNDPDSRPECPYGILCYRKNPQHKLDYKHTRTKRKRTQNPVGTAPLDDLSDLEDSMEESVDESEYEDSFIDDDDLDDDFDSDLEFDDLDDEISDDEDSKKKKKTKVKNKKEKKR